jgi:elongator complex protein 1
MPRGNLETVYPRALVLAGIRQHLECKAFKEAFLACQNHQVDLNIIYDYRPNLFMMNISLFIEQIKSISRIDSFLSKLSEEDVSKTLYKDTLAKRAMPDSSANRSTFPSSPVANGASSHGSEGKVNRICNAFLSVLTPRMSEHLQNVITAHVCKCPPDLVSALEVVGSLRRTDANSAEDAVSHLCFLTDVNLLYDTALSLYDLPLTLLVAEQAQRDPREYMPFLQSLHDLPELRRNFTIDDHLRHYSKALISLHALGAHDEVENYVTKHALYQQALELYRYDPEHLTTITRLHATHLTSQSNHLASAIASESLAEYSLASSSYAKCSPPHWREALHCGSMIQPPLPKAKIQSLALQLATTLVEEQRDYRSASQIHADYLHDIPTAVRLLCRGSYFAEGLRLLSLHSLAPQIPDLIDVGLAEKSGEITELIANCRSQLAAQVPRIKELRVRRAEDPLAFFGGDPTLEGGEGDFADNISLAPTDASTMGGQSLFTRYTGNNKVNGFTGTVASHNMSDVSRKTSRTRRREERKRARGKKGSVYEEEYLVGSVKRLIERVNGVHGEVWRLVQGLARRGMRERGKIVQGVMEEITKECEGAVKDVWEDDEGRRVSDESGTGVGAEEERQPGGSDRPGARPKGADGVFWESQVEAERGRKDAPNVKAWKGVGF